MKRIIKMLLIWLRVVITFGSVLLWWHTTNIFKPFLLLAMIARLTS